jgi:hypothetical protein
LLNLTQSEDASNVITRLIPYGGLLEEGQPGYVEDKPSTPGIWNGNRLTIATADGQNGSLFIRNQAAEAVWGVVVGTATFDSIKVNGCKLKVEKGEGKPSDHYKLRNMDIKPISTDEITLSKNQNFFIAKWWYWGIFALAMILTLAGLAIYRKIEKTHANTSLMRTRRASKVAQRRLKKAQENLENHDSNGFYTETLTALWGYLSDKLTIPVSELSKDNIAVEMEQFGFQQQHIDDTIEMLETCEFAQYAPSLDDGNMPAVYDKCAQLIDQLEKVKRSKNPTK